MVKSRCFLAVFFSIVIVSAVSYAMTSGRAPAYQTASVQDDVFSDKFIFDSNLNIVRKADFSSSYQQKPEQGTHYYIEAKNLRYNAQFIDAEWTVYPAVWPLFNAGAIAKAGPNKYSGWYWTNKIPEEITPKVEGAHKLWIRWVRWKQLPAPLIVRIKQNGNTVAEKTLGSDANIPNMFQAQVVWESVDVNLDKSPVGIELEKPADNGLAGDRIIDGLYLTSDINYIPVGRIQLPQMEQLQECASYISGGKSVVMWANGQPWRGYGIHDWPMGADITSSINLEACINEKEPFLLKMTSMIGKPLNLSIQQEPFKNKRGKSFSAMDVRVAALMDTLGYGWMAQPLLRRSSVGLAPYHTAGLWVTINTEGMPAGTYQGGIILSDGSVKEHFTVNLTIYPIEIKRRPEFWTMIWGGTVACPNGVDSKEQYLRDIASHGINYLHYADVFSPDYADLVKQLGFVAGHAQHGNGVYWSHFMGRSDYDSEDFKVAMVRALSGTAKWRDELGFDGKHFSTSFEDEQGLSEHWYKVLTAAKATNVELLLRMNPVHLTAQDIALMNGLIDIWQPHENVYTDTKTTEALLAAKGKKTTYGIYYLDNANPEKSWRQIRKLPWKAFSLGLEGCGFWTYSAYQGEPWDDFDFPGNVSYFTGAGQGAVVYPGTKGPIPTPCWEAWREGREEVDLMYILKDEINKASAQGKTNASRKAKFMLDKAQQIVLNAEDSSDYTKAKERIIGAIMELRIREK